MKHFTTTLLFAIIYSQLCCQEGVRPLNSNLSYIYKTVEHANFNQLPNTEKAKTEITSLFLPFKEDFSYACLKKYPDTRLWLDSNVYVNTGYPIAPPSVGVATFDGLNKHGYPYTPNLTNLSQSLPADTLTSKPINLFSTSSGQNLQVSDSIALTFYYQARGNGEAPESNDSLLLDFYMPSQKTWSTNVWFSRGNINSNTNDTVFKRAFVWIKDTAFLRDGFKFRLRNTATTSGDFDHWHLDYLYLDKNRNKNSDTLYNDLTFANISTPFLKNYTSMPFEQYDSTEMAEKISVRIENNSVNYINHRYDLNIYNSNNQLLHQYSGGKKNLCPFKPSNYSACSNITGYSRDPAHANPTFGYTFSPMTDSADFTIKQALTLTGNTGDFFNANDTITQFQKFRNYYALDDGSAEGGYYVNAIGGKMAMKFKLNYFDTLQAVRIYFDPVGTVPLAESSYSFIINLWSDAGNMPGNVIFTEKVMYPIYYKSGHKEHPEYKLTVASGLRKLGPGTYYIGFQQKIATGIAVGFDKNTDHHERLYYDLGNGWTQSTIPGSIMIHPVFGRRLAAPVGVSENTKANLIFNVYPNPSNTKIYLQSEDFGEYNIQIIDALGRTILNDSFNDYESTIDATTITNGIYFLTISEKGKIKHQQKIIVQH